MGHRGLLFSCLGLVALTMATPTHAANDATEAGWIDAEQTNCKIWALPFLRSPDYKVAYEGPCKDGKAHGIGKATFLLKRGGQSFQSWRGYFRDGYFLGQRMINEPLTPLPSGDFLIGLASDKNIQFFIHEISDPEAGLDLCSRYGGKVMVVAPDNFAFADEAATEQLLTQAGTRYRAFCKDDKDVDITVVPKTYKASAGASSTSAIEPILVTGKAREGAGGKPLVVSVYNNKAAEEARRKKNAEKAAARQAEATKFSAETRKVFDDFSKQYRLVNWIKAEQLVANPFRWEGKVVGMRISFDRMVSRSSAIVHGLDGGGIFLLDNVPDTLFTGPGNAIVAVRVGKHRTFEDPARPAKSQEVSLLATELVGSKLCQLRGCMDAFDWLGFDLDKFPWGGDQSAYLKN